MCGIAGAANRREPVDARLVAAMTTRLRHRGPDDEGFCLIETGTTACKPCSGNDTVAALELPSIFDQVSCEANLILGHRRLSILDLSTAGHQPMRSESGRSWIVYNGEVYNYLELRSELEQLGYSFQTDSDTEIVLAAYEAWGVECLQRFNGMWALAIWDCESERLFCARDRFGIKPFFYYCDEKRLRFASELKALLVDPDVPRGLNESVVFDYLAHAFADHRAETFIDGVYQLPAGHYFVWDPKESRSVEPVCYWDLQPDNRAAAASDEEYAQRFGELMEDAVRLRLRADVTVGSCLSGGLDSSTIVCLANKLLREGGTDSASMGEQQKTFSSCFEDRRFDERQYIEDVLAATGAEQNYVFPDGARLIDELPQLLWHADYPVVSTSCYAQWNVMRTVRERGVTVVLDGQGSDELLAGYDYHRPFFLLDRLSRGDMFSFSREWSAYRESRGYGLLSSARELAMVGSKVWCGGLKEQVKSALGSEPHSIFPWVARDFFTSHYEREEWGARRYKRLLNECLYRFLKRNLPGLLRYEDRSSMAFSIESRVPFLDYRLAEFVFSLPENQKVRHGLTKYVLRQATTDVLPASVRNRTDKMGFVTPEMYWVRDYVGAYARDVIQSAPATIRDFFDADGADNVIDNSLLEDFGAKRYNTVWRMMNLCLWHELMLAPPPKLTAETSSQPAVC